MAEAPDDFPKEFTVQRIRTVAANALAPLSPQEISAYLHANPNVAKDVLNESYDKRWTPASFIEHKDGRYRVGWFSSTFQFECVRWFDTLPDAATDYLLFSLGRGRWSASVAAI